MNKKLALPFFFFLFVFLVTPAFAYEQYNDNFNFTDPTNLMVYDSGFQTVEIGYCPTDDIIEWIICSILGGQTINTTVTTTVFNDSYNYVEDRFEFVNNVTMTDIDHGVLGFKLTDANIYIKSKDMADLSASQYYNSTFLIPANKEIGVYVRYYINDTSDIDDIAILGIYDHNGEINDDEGNSQNLTWANGWNTQTVYIPAKMIDYNATFWLWIGYNDPDSDLNISIAEFDIFTFDQIESLPAIFSSSFAKDRCENTGSPSVALASTGIIDNRDGNVKISYFTTGSPRNFQCSVIQYNNTVMTRRTLDVDITANDEYFFIARDIVLLGIGDAGVCKECALYHRISPGVVVFTCLETSDHSPSVPKLEGSSTGNLSISTIYDVCQADTTVGVRQQHLLPVFTGEQWRYMLDYGDPLQNTDWLDMFSQFCRTETQCSGNVVYSVNYDCSTTQLYDCGVLGCNSDGDDCLFPLDSNGSTLEPGQYCCSDIGTCAINNNYAYLDISTVTGVTTKSCIPPKICREITDTSILCLTDQELEDYLVGSETTSYIGDLIADVLGLEDLDAGMNMFAIFLTIIISIGVAIKLDPNHAFQVFAITSLVLFMTFWGIGWIPTSQAIIVVFGIAVIIAVTFGKNLTGGG